MEDYNFLIRVGGKDYANLRMKIEEFKNSFGNLPENFYELDSEYHLTKEDLKKIGR